jgi:hypothetical protein
MLRAIRDDRNKDDPFTGKGYAFGHSVLKVRDADELREWISRASSGPRPRNSDRPPPG